MITMYVCERDRILKEKIKDVFRMLAWKHQLEVCIKDYGTGTEMLYALEQDAFVPDVIWLDIGIEGGGLELARTLRSLKLCKEIVLFVENDEDVLASFEIHPLSCLLKGKSFQRSLKTVFVACIKKMDKNPPECLVCSRIGIMKRIPLNDILYIEAHGRMSRIYEKEDVFEISTGLGALTAVLSEKGFIRVNRRCLLNTLYICEKEQKKLTLIDGKEVFVGAAYSLLLEKRLTYPLWEVAYCNISKTHG